MPSEARASQRSLRELYSTSASEGELLRAPSTPPPSLASRAMEGKPTADVSALVPKPCTIGTSSKAQVRLGPCFRQSSLLGPLIRQRSRTCYEKNWLEAASGKGWFVALRIYGPLEPRIEKTWRPSEIISKYGGGALTSTPAHGMFIDNCFRRVSVLFDPENPRQHPKRLAWTTPGTSQRIGQGFVPPETGTAPGRPCR